MALLAAEMSAPEEIRPAAQKCRNECNVLSSPFWRSSSDATIVTRSGCRSCPSSRVNTQPRPSSLYALSHIAFWVTVALKPDELPEGMHARADLADLPSQGGRGPRHLSLGHDGGDVA
jgi:hypothetical protein